MENEERMLCPTCNAALTYVRELTREERESGIRSSGDRFSVPLDSHISRCPEHRLLASLLLAAGSSRSRSGDCSRSTPISRTAKWQETSRPALWVGR